MGREHCVKQMLERSSCENTLNFHRNLAANSPNMFLPTACHKGTGAFKCRASVLARADRFRYPSACPIKQPTENNIWLDLSHSVPVDGPPLLHPTMTGKKLENGFRLAAKYGVAFAKPMNSRNAPRRVVETIANCLTSQRRFLPCLS